MLATGRVGSAMFWRSTMGRKPRRRVIHSHHGTQPLQREIMDYLFLAKLCAIVVGQLAIDQLSIEQTFQPY